MSKVLQNASALLLAAGMAVSSGAAPLALQRQAMQKVSGSGPMPTLRMETTVDLLPTEPGQNRYNFVAKPDDGLFRVQSPTEERRQRALKSATAAFRALDDNIDVRGQMTYHDMWDDSNWMRFQGFYSLPHNDKDYFVLRGLTSNGINWGGFYDPEGEIYYGIASDLSLSEGGGTYCYNIAYDTQTWQRVSGEALPDFRMCAFSVARDPLTELVYGYYINDFGNGMIWAEADYQSATRTKIADVEFTDRMILMASDDAGEFYGININGELCKINKADGSSTVIAPTTLPILYRAGAVINNRNHTMLATTFHLDYGSGGIFDQTGSSGLWEINLETGETTRVAQFTGDIQVQNLYIDRAVAEKAPDVPGLKVTAPEGSMTAHWEMTVPETLYDGTPLTGLVDWQVAVEGKKIAEGRNQAGSTVAGDILIEKVGETTFSAFCYNDDGESARATVKIFVGNGLPNAPKNVALSYADGKLTLTWNAVATSSDGGYVNPAEVVYTIKSIDGTTFDGGTGTTSWELQIEEPAIRTIYQYSVTATFAGQSSPETVSNFIALGAYETPYDITLAGLPFNFAATNLGYTAIDGNGDTTKWGFGTSGASYKTSNSRSQQADDWMVMPEVYLEEGKVYEFTAQAYTQVTSLNKPQILSVYVGQGTTQEALSTMIVEESEVCASKSDPYILRGTFKAPATGGYNFAIRCTTPRKSPYGYDNTVYIPEIHITGGMSEASPQIVTDVTVTPEATGLHSAKISCKAPTVNIMGEPLTGRVTIDIYRDGEKVKSTTASAGGTVNYTDNVDQLGNYSYSIVPSQGEAFGPPYRTSVFIGPYAAMAPDNVKILEAYQPGYVMVYWDPVTRDINNNTISASNVTYMVYKLVKENNQSVLAPALDAPIKECSAVILANENPEKQHMVEYFVKASNREAEGSYSRSPYIAVGTAYKLPVKYTEMADLNSYVMGTGAILGGASFSFVGNGDGVIAQDNDDCFFASNSDILDGKSCYLFTGKIDLADCERPELSFYTWKLDDEDDNVIQTHILCDGKFETVTPAPDYGNIRHENLKSECWTKVRYDLSKYKGKYIQIRITASHNTHYNTLLDNIRIQEVADKDLVATSISAPAQVKSNEKFDISVSLTSFGWQPAKDFTVDLYRDGEIVDSQVVAELNYEEETTVVFENAMTPFDENGNKAVFSAEIVFDGDKDMTNNTTDEVTVERLISTMPVVEDLQAELTDNGTRLTWTPYVLDVPAPAPYTEDFEDALPWSTELEGWTFVDEDKERIVRRLSTAITLPFPSGAKLPWFVFDDSEWPDQAAALAHSGHKYLGASSSDDYDDDEGYYPLIKDWAISPVLTGEAQTITFWAKSFSSGDRIQVWYATEVTDDIKKFTQIKPFGNTAGNQTVTKDWAEYSVELPEGAMRFALRSYSECKKMLMVDDVTYTPDLAYGLPVLVGYDVYRDGVKINDAPVTGGEYLDTDMPTGNHTYHVVGVFDSGEAELSNPAEVYLSAVDMAAYGSASVTVEGHDIVVRNAGDSSVAVVTVDGRLLYRGNGDFRLTVAPGIYLVTVGTATTKLYVD